MWYNICCMSTMTTSGVEGSTCTTPRRLQRTDLLPFRKQPYSSMSDGGTEHNSYWNMVVSYNCRCCPTTRRRMKMASKSNIVFPPTLMPRFSCSILFTWLEILPWKPFGKENVCMTKVTFVHHFCCWALTFSYTVTREHGFIDVKASAAPRRRIHRSPTENSTPDFSMI